MPKVKKSASEKTKGRVNRPSLVTFILVRYSISLLAVLSLTSALIFWLLMNAQNKALDLSYMKTSELFVSTVRQEAIDYNVEALHNTLATFAEVMGYERVDIISPYDFEMASFGDQTLLKPDLIIPVEENGADFGQLRVWFGESQSIWAITKDIAFGRNAFVAAFYFCCIGGLFSLVFTRLVRSNIREPLQAIIWHMQNTGERILLAKTQQNNDALDAPLPFSGTAQKFRETAEVRKAYDLVIERWIDAHQAEVSAKTGEEHQKNLLREVLDLSQISIVVSDDAQKMTHVGTPLSSAFLNLLSEGGLRETKIADLADAHGFSVQEKEIGGSKLQQHHGLEIADSDQRIRAIKGFDLDGQRAMVVREVTKERELEEALLKSEKLKTVGALTSSITHDFNNVLATLSSNLELMEILNNDDVRIPDEIIATLQASLSSISSRIKSLKKLSGGGTGNATVVDQHERLQQLKVFFAPMLGTSMELVCEFESTDTIVCDLGEFDSCITNLVVNARNAQNGIGKIMITSRPATIQDFLYSGKKENFLAIDVKDSGPGVPESIAPHIFDPFFTTLKHADGTGLGLAQVRAFCERSGGAVYLHPRDEGFGAVFTLLLPLSEEANTNNTLKRGFKGLGAENLTIHILDDNLDLARTNALILRKFGATVTVWENFDDIKRATQNGDVEGVLLSDVFMPDCVYQEVVELAATSPSTLELIFYSGNEDALSSLSREYPYIQTLDKPYSVRRLIEKIEKTRDPVNTAPG